MIGRLDSFREGESEQEIMVLYRAEYMVCEPEGCHRR